MPATTDPASPRRPWWFAIASKPWSPVALVLLVLAASLLWQALSPYTLIEDEAHYWEWSRRLDWSYYSKGPGVALLIRASTAFLGTSEFAVRLPAAVSIAVGALGSMLTARELFRDRIVTFTSTLLFFCVPGFAFSSMLMTIDAPYLACWSWASYFALRAINRRSRAEWIGFGLVLALGFLFKYTILILIPGVALALLLEPKPRPRLAWALLGTLLVALGLVPVLIWNAHHDWATLRHLLGHLGMHGGDTENTLAGPGEPYTPRWTLEYLALILLVGGAVMVLGVLGWINTKKHASPAEHTQSTRLLAFGLPVIVFYFLVSFKAQTEGNWPMSGFVTLVPLAAWAAKDALVRTDHPVRVVWGTAFVTGLVVYGFFPSAAFLSTRRLIGPIIPIHRITGMHEHAQAAQSALDTLREQTGLEPFIITDHYGRASQLAFYLPEHPTVYCNSALVGGRQTQYDLWPETNLRNPDTAHALAGRPALLFGGRERMWRFGFDDLTEIGALAGEPKAHGTTFTGRRYHGFELWTPPPPKHPSP